MGKKLSQQAIEQHLLTFSVNSLIERQWARVQKFDSKGTQFFGEVIGERVKGHRRKANANEKKGKSLVQNKNDSKSRMDTYFIPEADEKKRDMQPSKGMPQHRQDRQEAIPVISGSGVK